MAARWFVAVWELQLAYKDSTREGKRRLRGSCGWVAVGVPEVPRRATCGLGYWERMRATARRKQRAGRVSRVGC